MHNPAVTPKFVLQPSVRLALPPTSPVQLVTSAATRTTVSAFGAPGTHRAGSMSESVHQVPRDGQPLAHLRKSPVQWLRGRLPRAIEQGHNRAAAFTDSGRSNESS